MIQKPPKAAVIRFRCEDRQKIALEELAAGLDLDTADLMRHALRDYLKKHGCHPKTTTLPNPS